MTSTPSGTSSGHDEVTESLIAYGAPLAGRRGAAHQPVEEILVKALALSHEDATLLRVLPVVLARHRSSLDYSRLCSLARQSGQAAELGMLFELTAEAAGLEELRQEAQRLALPSGPARYYFAEPGHFAKKLAEERTPAVVRKWGFLMNMPLDSFRSLLREHDA